MNQNENYSLDFSNAINKTFELCSTVDESINIEKSLRFDSEYAVVDILNMLISMQEESRKDAKFTHWMSIINLIAVLFSIIVSIVLAIVL